MSDYIENIIAQIERVVIGKPEQVKLSLACLLAKGHLLIEDLPGMGKTTLAHVLASTSGLSYQRVQFTSDLLPADIIGVSIFDQQQLAFTFHKGPLFNQVVLADEINRASPKAQSALLEAMEENRVSVDGVTYELPEPFFVIATQNPLFHAGTYPLPESQLDRFMMKISLGFPDRASEKAILKGDNARLFEQLSACINLSQLTVIQEEVNKVYVADEIIDYVVALCECSRHTNLSVNPLSPRAGKSLIAASKAWAYIHQRDHVLPDDIKAVFISVCEHRLVGSRQQPQGDNQRQGSSTLAEQLLSSVNSHRPFESS
ncbi:MoxR family ATPase [Thalassotalea sp. 1_MG-2023]|uniref:AAA family ATPase n=1 Tax=Thalassotalea sp. 1_MG-2023 TaxID=3062680 RepID=UPI0026E2EE1A|nr:MoxR family ATPase [Thalassotalea sp. 1_MG-2023]MDO6428722.1 MoxR family ATPase [Thalassotalea sp. 1_MG-2023]